MKKQHFVCMGLVCAMLWAACSNNHKEVSSADTVSTAGTNLDTASTLKTAKLVKTADMRFKVKNVERVCEDVSALTTRYKGMVMHHSMRSEIGRSLDVPSSSDSLMRVSSYSTNADMVVKIPSGQVEEFMNIVGKMALYINNRNMDIQDKTLEYLSAQMKLVSRTAIIDQQKKGVVKIKDAAQVMNLKDDLIDQQIDNKRIDDAVKYSTIALNFYQSNTVAREVVVNDDPSAFKLPLTTRFGQAIATGWMIFTDCLVGLANLWMFILAAVGGWFAYRLWKKKPAVAVV